MNPRDELLARQIELYRRQAFWEPYKAIAAIIAAGAVFFGGTIAMANCWRPAPLNITVHVERAL
jgi:hypothetical protein